MNVTRIVSIVFCITIICAGSLFAADSDEITVKYSFTQPAIERITLSGEAFDRVRIDGLTNSGAPGQPSLPAQGARILLPLGTRAASVTVETGQPVSLGTGYIVEPTARNYKLSAPPVAGQPLERDPAIYMSDQPFPGHREDVVGTYGFRGYSLLTVKLNPVEYIPSTGEILYYPDITVRATLADAPEISELFRGQTSDEKAVMAKVDNPQRLQTYPATADGSKSYDLLIITTSSLAGSFQPLKDYHDNTGIMTEIRTTTDIGSSDPTDIRDYIRDAYQNDGIEYVLIGADDNYIPALNLWVQSWSGGDIVTDMPGDVYFSCLDGTYNFDGDGYNGEPSDGVGGGNVDLVAEVYVGRASVGSSTEAARFVNKTIAYLQTSDSYLENALMCGEYLGFGGTSDYAGNMMDQMVDGSSADGYTTVGIPSSIYTFDYLYDRDWSGNDWPASQLISRINSGVHIINHLGHGYNNYAMKMYSTQLTGYLNNSDPLFLFSQACLAGHFDGTDCWAEYMTIKSNYGAFAVVMNAREGWGSEYSTDGPSQRYNRQFWDAIFNASENKPELGRALADCKEDNLYRINESCMRWCYYEITLFGDPTVVIRGQQSLTFDYPGGAPRMTTPGVATTFDVVATGANGGSVVPGTGQLHYRVNGGSILTAGMTEISTGHYQASLPALDCGDYVEYYVSAEEAFSGRIYDPSPSEPFKAAPSTGTSDFFVDDYETDKGWTVSGDAADGHWERGIPAFADRGDPETDYDGSGQCYVTGCRADNSDVDDGSSYLDSPVFDLDGIDGEVHYAHWYCNDYGGAPEEDVLVVYVSNNGGTDWVAAYTVGPAEGVSGGWVEHSFWISDFVEPSSQIRVRFDVSDLGDPSVVEAGIDAFRIVTTECIVEGDDDDDGIVNSIDNCISTYNPLQEDADGDEIGNACDACPYDDENDADNDGYCADVDNCPDTYNPDQIDVDEDGFGVPCDCDDGNYDVNPNTVWYADADGDGYGDAGTTMVQCEQPTGYILDNTDCNDGDSTVNPATIWYQDGDEDGFGNPLVSMTQCEQPTGYCLDSTDCDDSNGDVNPATQWYADTDSDGYGDPATSVNACEQPAGYVLDSTDNCPTENNPEQEDFDGDGLGDACDTYCCMGTVKGNLDCDELDEVTMGDLTVMIDHLFITLSPLCCDGEGDMDDDGDVTMGDLTVLIDHLFITLSPLPECP